MDYRSKFEKERKRLNFVLRIIRERGTNGIGELYWTVREENGEDSDIAFDRPAIDRAMREKSA